MMQIKCILENDHTLQGMSFRIKVDGKGCSGFTYSTGLSFSDPQDYILTYIFEGKEFSLLLDSFTGFYLQKFHLDYIFDPLQDIEGFVVTNDDEHHYQGKFWKGHPELIPSSK